MTKIDERGNPMISNTERMTDLAFNMPGADPATTGVVQGSLDPSKSPYTHRTDVFDLIGKGWDMNTMAQKLPSTHLLTIEPEEAVREKYKEQIPDDDDFDLFYSQMWDAVRNINENRREVTRLKEAPKFFEMLGYERLSPKIAISPTGKPKKYGAAADDFPVLYSDEQLATMKGKYRVHDSVNDQWFESDFNWYDRLTGNFILQYQEDGEPFWQEMPWGNNYEFGQVMSFFGDQKPHRHPIWAYPAKFLSAGTTELGAAAYRILGFTQYNAMRHLLGQDEEDILSPDHYTGPRSALESAGVPEGKFPKWLGVPEGGSQILTGMSTVGMSPQNSWAAANFLQKFTFKQTERAEQSRWQELMNPFHRNNNFGDFTFFLSEMIGMLMPQRAIPWAINQAAKKSIAKLTPEIFNTLKTGAPLKMGQKGWLMGGKEISVPAGKYLGASDKVLNEAAQAIAMHQAMPTSMTMRSISMGIGTTQALSGAWIDESLNAGIPMDDLALTLIYAAPFVSLTEWFLTSKLWTRGLGTHMNRKMLAEYLGTSFKSTLKDMGKDAVGKKGFNALFTTRFLKNINASASWAASKPLLAGTIREGAQEGSEEVLYEALRLAYNKNLVPGARDKGLPWGKQKPEDKPQFEHYLGSEGFTDRIMADVVGGMWGGGLFDGMIGIAQSRAKQNYTRRQVSRNKRPDFAKMTDYAIRKADFGGRDIGVDGNPLSENSPVADVVNKDGKLDQYGVPRNWEIKTMHDLLIWQEVQSYMLEEMYAERAGMNDPIVSEMFEKDLRLAEEAMDAMKAIREVDARVTEIEESLKTELAKEERTKAETDLKTAQADQQNAWAQMDRITKIEKGKQYSERMHELILDREAVLALNNRYLPVDIARNALHAAVQRFNKNTANVTEWNQKRSEARKTASEVLHKLSTENIAELAENPNKFLSKFLPEIIGKDISQTDLTEKTKDVLEQIGEYVNDEIAKIISSIQAPAESSLFNKLQVDEAIEELGIEQVKGRTRDEHVELSEKLNEAKTEEERVKLETAKTQAWQNVQALESYEGATRTQEALKLPEQTSQIDPIEFYSDQFEANEEFHSLENNIEFVNKNLDRISDPDVNRALANLKKALDNKMEDLILLKAAMKADNDLGYNISKLESSLTEEQVNQISEHHNKLKNGYLKDDVAYDGVDMLWEKSLEKAKQRSQREHNRANKYLFHDIVVLNQMITLLNLKGFISEPLKEEIEKFVIAEVYEKTKSGTVSLSPEELAIFQKKFSEIKSKMHEELKKSNKGETFSKAAHEELLKFIASQTDIRGEYTRPSSTIYITPDGYINDYNPINFIENLNSPLLHNSEGTLIPNMQRSYINHYVVQYVNLANEIAMVNSQNADKIYAESIKNINFGGPLNAIASIEQYRAVKQIYAWYENDGQHIAYHSQQGVVGNIDNAILKKIYDKKVRKIGAFNVVDGSYLENIIVLPAGGGAGKSTVVPRTLFRMFQETGNQQDKSYNILVVAPTEEIGEKITSQAQGLDKINISGNVVHTNFIKNYSKYKNFDGLIILDEGSRFTTGEVSMLLKNQPSAKMLVLLDPNQARNTNPTQGNEYLPILRYTPRTNAIDEVFRTGDPQIWGIQKTLDENIVNADKTKKIEFIPVSKHTVNYSAGLWYGKTVKDVVSLWYDNKNTVPGKHVLIFEHANDILSMIDDGSYAKNVRDAIEQGVKDGTVRFVNDYTSDSSKPVEGVTIQGSEVSHVYSTVMLKTDLSEEAWVDNVTTYKTAAGRAQNFLAIVYDGRSQEALEKDIVADAEAMSEIEYGIRQDHIVQMSDDVEYTSDFVTAIKTETQIKDAVEDKEPVSEESVEDDPPQSSWEHPSVKGTYTKNQVWRLKPTSKNKSFEAGQDYAITEAYVESNGNVVFDIKKVTSEDVNRITEKALKRSFEQPSESSVEKTPDTFNTPKDNSDLSQLELWASRYDHDKGILPFNFATSIADSKTIENYAKWNNERVNEILNTLSSRSQLDLVFYREKSLYKYGKGDSATATSQYNVILIQTKDGKILGSLYQPIINRQEWTDYNERKWRRSDFKPKNVNQKIEPNKIEWESGTNLRRYTEALVDLYNHGVENATDNTGVVVGTMTLTGDMKGATAHVNHNQSKHQSLTDIINKSEARGALWTKSEGLPLITLGRSKTDPNRLEYFASMTYMTSRPDSKVDIEVKGPKMKDIAKNVNYAYLVDRFKEAVSDVVAEISRANTTDAGVINSIINKSVFKDVLNYNRSLIVREEGVVNELQDFIELRDGLPDIKIPKEADAKWMLKYNINTIGKWLIDNGYFVMGADKGQKIALPMDPKSVGELLPLMKTPVQDLTTMLGRGIIKKADVKREGKPTGKTNYTRDMFDTLTKEDALHNPPTDQTGGKKLAAAIFGESFLNQTDPSLILKPNLKLNGQDVWGYVHDFKMHIEIGKDGDFSASVFKHEAVHYAIKHFVSPDTRVEILQAVQEHYLREEGKTLSLKQAEEHLAEINRGDRVLKESYQGITGKIKQFVDWFSKLVFNVRIFGNEADVFLKQLRTGEFVDRTPIYNNYDAPAAMAKLGDLLTEESTTAVKELKPTRLTRDQLIDIFGNQSLYYKAIRNVKENSIKLSRYNMTLDDNIGDIFDGAVQYGNLRRNTFGDANNVYSDINSYKELNQYLDKNPGIDKDKARDSYFYTKVAQNDPSMPIMSSLLKMAFSEYVFDNTEESNRKRRYDDSVKNTQEHGTTFVNSWFDTIPLIYHAVSDGNVIELAPEYQTPKARVNSEKLRNALYGLNIASDVYNSEKASLSKDERFFDKVLTEAKRLLEGSEAGDVEMANMLLSFHRVMVGHDNLNTPSYGIGNLFNSPNSPVQYAVRDLAIASHAKNILLEAYGTEEIARDMYDRDNVREKIKATGELYAAVMAIIMSSSTQGTSNVVEVQSGKDANIFRPELLNHHGWGAVKELMKHNIRQRLMPDGAYDLSLHQSLKEGLKPYYFKMNVKDGVVKFYWGQEKISFLDGHAKSIAKARWEVNPEWLSMRKKDLSAAVRSMLNGLGIYVTAKEASYLVNRKGEYDIHKLATFLGNAYSIVMQGVYKDAVQMHAYELETGKIDELSSFESIADEYKKVGRYYDNIVQKAVNAVNITENVDEFATHGEPGGNISVTRLIDDINAISRLKAHYNQNTTKSYSYNAANEKITPNIQHNTLVSNYPHLDTPNQVADVLRRKMDEYLDTLTPEERAKHPLNYDFVKSGKMKVKIYLETGMKTKFKGINQKSYTQTDYWNNVLGSFYDSLLSGRKMQELVVHPDNYGDSSTHIQAHVVLSSKEGSSQPFDITMKDGEITNIKINDNLFNDYLNDELQQEYALYEASMERWMNATRMFGENIGQPLMKLTNAKKLFSEKRSYEKDIQMQNELQDAINKHEPTKLLQLLAHTNLQPNVDYIYDGTSIVLGSSSTFAGNQFSIYNIYGRRMSTGLEYYHKWNESKAKDHRTSLRKELFGRRYYNFKEQLKLHKLEELRRLPEEMKKSFYMDEYKEGVFTHQRKWNPFYEGLLYTQHFAARHFQTINVASPNQFTRVWDYGKRAKAGAVSGITPVVGLPYGVAEQANWVKLQDYKKQHPGFAELFGVNDTPKISDGQRIIHGLSRVQYIHSVGSDQGVVKSNHASIKTVNAGMDYQSMTGRFVKSNTFGMTQDEYNTARKKFNERMKYFLSGETAPVVYEGNVSTLIEIYERLSQEGMSYNDVINELQHIVAKERIFGNESFGNNVITGIIFESDVKIPDRGQNLFSLDGLDLRIAKGKTAEVALYNLQYNTEKVQQDPVYEESTVQMPTQINNMLFNHEGNFHVANEMRLIDSVQAEREADKLMKKIEKDGYESMLREKGSTIIPRLQGVTHIKDALSKPNISIRFPQYNQLLSPLMAKLFTQGLYYRTTGRELLQKHDLDMIEFITLEKDGKLVTGITDGDLDVGLYKDWKEVKREPGLKPIRVYDIHGNEVLQEAQTRLANIAGKANELLRQYKEAAAEVGEARDLAKIDQLESEWKKAKHNHMVASREIFNQAAKQGYIVPEEVAIPHYYLKEFGIDLVGQPSLKNIMTFKIITEGTEDIVDVRDYVKANSDNYYKDRSKGIAALAEFIRAHWDNVSNQSFISRLVNDYQFIEGTPEAIAEYYSALIDTLDVVVLRKPTSAWNAVFAGEVKYILYHTDGHIVTSGLHVIRDGSDNDGDHLNVLFRNVKREGKRTYVPNVEGDLTIPNLRNQDNRTLDNARFNRYYETFTNPEFAHMMLEPVKHQELIDRGLEAQPNEDLNHAHADISTTAYFYNANKGTERLVGYGATSVKQYGIMQGLSRDGVWNKYIQPKWANIVKRMKGGEIISETELTSITNDLGTVLQSYLEDAKHGIVSDLNLNIATAPLVLPMLYSGMSIDEAITFLLDPDVLKIVKEAYNTFAVNERQSDIWTVAKKHLDNMITEETAEDFKDKMEERWNTRKPELNDELKEIDQKIKQAERNAPTPVITQKRKAVDKKISLEDLAAEVLDKPRITEQQKNEINKFLDNLAHLKKERKTLLGKIEYYGTDFNRYYSNIIKNNQKKYENIVRLRTLALEGEALRRLSTIVGMLRQIPHTDYDMYQMHHTLRHYLRSMNPEAFVDNMANNQETESVIEKYTNHLKIEKDQNNFLNSANQNTVNDLVKSFIGSISNALKGVDVTYFTTGDSGFGQAVINNADKKVIGDHNVQVIMPTDYLYRTEHGNNISGKIAQKAIENIAWRKNVKIEDTGGQYYPDAIKSVLQRSDVDVVIIAESHSGIEVDVAKGVAGRNNKIVIRVPQSTFNYKVGNEKKASNDIKNKVWNTVKPLLDQQKVQASRLEKKKLGIAIFGSNLYSMDKKSITDQQHEIEMKREEAIDVVMNVGEVVRNHPKLKSAVKAFYNFYNTRVENTLSLKENIIAGMDMMATQMRRPYLNNYQFHGAQDIANGMVAHYIFNKIVGDEKITLIHDNSGDHSLFENIDIRTNKGLMYFLLEFPHFVADTNSNSLKVLHPNNQFLKDLSIGEYGNLNMDGEQQYTDYEIDLKREAFNDLEPNVQRMFMYYDLAKYAFRNNSLRKYMGVGLMEKISTDFEQVLTGENKTGHEVKSVKEFWTNFDNSYVDKAMVISQHLGMWLTDELDQNLKMEDKPDYIKRNERVRYQDGILKGQTRTFVEKKLKKSTITTEDGSTYTDYIPVSPLLGTRPAIIDPGANTEVYTDMEVIGIEDVRQARNLMRNAMAIKNFPFGHGYKPRFQAKVMGETHVINKSSNTSIKITPIQAESRVLGIQEVNVSREKAVKVIQKLQRRLPHLGIKTVTNETTHLHGKKAYIMNNEVHYNLDLVTGDTFIHEIMHPILLMAKNSSNESLKVFHEMVMEKVLSEIEDNTTVVQAIRKAYPDLQGEAFQHEVASVLMGMNSVEKVEQIVSNDAQSIYQGVKQWVNRVYNAVKSLMREFWFGVDVNTASMAIDLLSPSNTLREMTEAMIQDIVDGKLKKFHIDDVYEMQPSVVQAESRPLTSINTISEFENDILFNGENTTVKEKNISSRVNDIYIRLEGELPGEKFFKEVDFNSIWQSGSERAIKQKIYDDIVSKNKEWNSILTESFTGWIKNGASPSLINNHFTKGHLNRYGADSFKKLAYLMSLDNMVNVHKYSELRDLQQYRDLARAYDSTLDDENVYVVVNSVLTNDKGQNEYDISIVDLNFESGFYANPNWENRKISAPYLTSDRQAKRHGITMMSNYNEVKNLKLMLIAMNMKDVLGDRVNFLNLRVISADNAGNIATNPLNLSNALQNINGLSQIEPFTNKLNGTLRKLFMSEALKDVNIYESDYMAALKNFWNQQDRIDKDGDMMANRSMQSRDHVREQMKIWLTEGSNINSLLRELRRHQEWLDDVKGLHTVPSFQKDTSPRKRSDKSDKKDYMTIYEARALDPESRYITMVINDLLAFQKIGYKNTMDAFDRIANNTYNYNPPLLQNLFAHIESHMNQIHGLHMAYTNEFDKFIETVNKKYWAKNKKAWSYLHDDAHKRFKPLFIDTRIVNGRLVDKGYNDMEIHHDENDPRTKKALRDGVIDEQMLEVGKRVVADVERFMKMIAKQEFTRNYFEYNLEDGNGMPNHAKIEKYTDNFYNTRWKKGWLPVMRSRPGELFSQGRIGPAVEKFFTMVKNPHAIFEEMLDLSLNSKKNEDTLHSFFFNQMMQNKESGDHITNRQRMLGLARRTDGEYYVPDQNKKANSIVTKNVNTIMKYLSMEALSKPILEEQIIPLVDDMMTVGNIISMIKTGEDQKMVMSTLKLQTDKQTKGTHIKLDFKLLGSDKIAKGIEGGIRTLLRLTQFGGTALSVPVTALSFAANTTEAVLEGIANKFFPDAHKAFDISDLSKAGWLQMTEKAKVRKIMDEMQVTFKERYSLLNDVAYDLTTNHFMTQNFLHGPTRWSDVLARQGVAISIMLRDGTYHAFDNDGVYHAKRDKRFYKSDGTQTAEQKALEQWLAQDLLIDPRYVEKQKISKKPDGTYMPVAPYSSKELARLQYYGAQFVVGVYDKPHTTAADNWLFYDVVSQFKKFVIAKYNTRLGKEADEQAGAVRTITKDKYGNFVKGWEPLKREGTWRTTGRVAKNLVAQTPWLGDILDSYHVLNKAKSLDEWKNMTVHEKRNLVRTALDVITVSLAYLLAYGMVAFRPDPPPDEWTQPKRLPGDSDWEYDKRVKRSIENYYNTRGKQELRTMRVVRAIQRGVTTALATTPYQLLDMATNWAIVSQAQRIMNVVTLNEPWKNMELILPGSSTVKSTKETIEFFHKPE